MHIALITIHTSRSPQAVPLANAFLISYMQGHTPADCIPTTDIIEFFIDNSVEDCVQSITAQRPSAVGFSMYVWNRDLCCSIARKLRNEHPEIRTIFAGGPEVTADPEGVLREACFDFIINGEGEKTFSDVCSKLCKNDVISEQAGLILRTDDINPPERRKPITNLDDIPSPWLNGTLDAAKYGGLLWQLSRGCAFSCDFCFDARGESGVRRFSLARIESELKHFAQNNVSQVFVLDSTFNQDADRAKKILRMIARIAPGIHFHFEVRNEFIDCEMAELFANITCSLQIGLQGSNPLIMKGVGRTFDRDNFSKKIAMLNNSGAVFGFDLIYGLPNDNLAGFKESLDYALGLYPNHLDIFPLAILPGTALAKRSSATGLEHISKPPYTLLSSPSFSAMELAEAARLASACDIFYTRGKSVAWFNSVVRALGLKPSQFLSSFADWLNTEVGSDTREDRLDDHQIWQIQRRFLSHLFDTKKNKRMLPLALDLLDYHYHYAAALLAPQPKENHHIPKSDKRLLEQVPALPPSTQLIRLNYEILEILEAGEPDLKYFSTHFSKSGSWVVIYSGTDGIRTESIDEEYFNLLGFIDGRTPCSQLANRAGLTECDAAEFIRFAAEEKIISINKV